MAWWDGEALRGVPQVPGLPGVLAWATNDAFSGDFVEMERARRV